MIKPTKKLIEFLNQFESQTVLTQLIGLDKAIVSKLCNNKLEATIGIMEAVYKFNRWPLDEAWEITDE